MTTSVGPPRRVDVRLDTGLKRDVNKLSLLFTGVGAIIGSGWLFGALYASQIAGPAAILSWAIGGVMVMVIGLVYAELGVMFPVSGGIIRFPHYSFGSFASFSSGWTSWLAAAAVTPIEVLATIQYADPYIPWLMNQSDGVFVLTGPGLAIAVALMFLYSLVNILGVKLFARLNNALVWWKLAVIALVVVAFFVLAFNPENLSSVAGFAPEGWGSVLTAIPAAGVAFAYLGFRNGIEFAGETDNPQKNVPFAIIGSILIAGIIYVLLQLAFITAVPGHLLTDGWANLAFEDAAGPLAGLSLVLGAVWLAVLLRVDAVISPADTGLIYAGVTARLSYANARNGNAPQALTKLNKRGIPWVSVLVMFIVGCFFFLPFPGWQQFIGFITSAFAISFGAGPLVLGALRRQLPDQERPFRVPGGDVLPYLAFLFSSLLVFWAGWAINEKMIIALLVGYVVFAIYHARNRAVMPPLEFKAGSWFPIWLVGLGIISYLGDVDPDQPADPGLILNGGDGPISLVWGFVILAVFSALVYAYAIAVRLPPERAARNISQAPTDEPAAI
ncbi:MULTISPECIES: APC family permease [Actinokineospora]|uniref:APC family permease n=1 Tax=Actinokineospora TaxID=39845 RepID=UPI00166F6932|nr:MULTISPECIES: APC family permease [Actinokineospora]UVS78782.1 L-aspartate transporter [Actinokineospora sp. UTMC 2448]